MVKRREEEMSDGAMGRSCGMLQQSIPSAVTTLEFLQAKKKKLQADLIVIEEAIGAMEGNPTVSKILDLVFRAKLV